MPQFLRPFHFLQMQCSSIIETCLCLATYSRLMGFHAAGHTNEFLKWYSSRLNVSEAQCSMRTENSEISRGFLWKLAKFRFHILLTYWLSAWSCWNRISECSVLLQNRHIDNYIFRHFLVVQVSLATSFIPLQYFPALLHAFTCMYICMRGYTRLYVATLLNVSVNVSFTVVHSVTVTVNVMIVGFVVVVAVVVIVVVVCSFCSTFSALVSQMHPWGDVWIRYGFRVLRFPTSHHLLHPALI